VSSTAPSGCFSNTRIRGRREGKSAKCIQKREAVPDRPAVVRGALGVGAQERSRKMHEIAPLTSPSEPYTRARNVLFEAKRQHPA